MGTRLKSDSLSQVSKVLNYAARILFITVLIPVIMVTIGCKQNDTADDQSGSAGTKQEQEQSKDESKDSNKSEAEGGNPMVIMSTSKGDIKIELYKDKAPITVENFLNYANSKFYDGTIFHRVIQNFMVQGGGFTPDLNQKPTNPPIKNEAENGLKNERGTLAMARTQVVDSATSQFFINLVDNSFLDNGVRDYGYAVFGRVVDGMDVVDEISAVETGSKGMMGDVPQEDVVIESVKVVE